MEDKYDRPLLSERVRDDVEENFCCPQRCSAMFNVNELNLFRLNVQEISTEQRTDFLAGRLRLVVNPVQPNRETTLLSFFRGRTVCRSFFTESWHFQA